MAHRRTPADDFDAPLTEAEQARVDALLAGVSTHTLLHSLAGLGRDSQDAHLIISALMQRLAAHAGE